MPDPSEYGYASGWTDSPGPTAQTIPSPRQAPPRPATVFDEIENRLMLAHYYRSVLQNPLFGDATYTDAFAARVQAEVNEFITNRMAALVGADVPDSSLTKDEIAFLKEFIKAMRSNQNIAEVATEPAVEQPQAPAPPVARGPTILPIAIPNAPRMRTEPPAQHQPVVRQGPQAPPVQAVPPTAAVPPKRRGRKPLSAVPTKRDRMRPTSDGAVPLPMPQGAAFEAVMASKAHSQLMEATVVETSETPRR